MGFPRPKVETPRTKSVAFDGKAATVVVATVYKQISGISISKPMNGSRFLDRNVGGGIKRTY